MIAPTRWSQEPVLPGEIQCDDAIQVETTRARKFGKQGKARDSRRVELNDRDGDDGECYAQPSYGLFSLQYPVLFERSFVAGGHGLRSGFNSVADMDFCASSAYVSRLVRLAHQHERGLESVVDLELVEDIRQVSFYGFFTDENLLADLLVG